MQLSMDEKCFDSLFNLPQRLIEHQDCLIVCGWKRVTMNGIKVLREFI